MKGAWIRRFRPAPDAAACLVCFPHAGGAATSYVPLFRAMSSEVDVLAVQYPGRQDRIAEACFDDISALADRIADELVPWTRRPVGFFGHSMGAAVAFEVALRLQRSGVSPLGLVVSGRRAPSAYRHQRLHLASDADLVAELTRLSPANATVFADETLRRMILPTIRSDYRAIERYRNLSGELLRCPITALAAEDDPVTDVDEVEIWVRHTLADFRMRVFRGGHFFLDDNADAVRAEIRRHLVA